jgi:hypothetical protein
MKNSTGEVSQHDIMDSLKNDSTFLTTALAITLPHTDAQGCCGFTASEDWDVRKL